MDWRFVANTMTIAITSCGICCSAYAVTGMASNARENLASRKTADTISHVPLLGQQRSTTEGHSMQTLDDTGCLTQRSQLERLRELADSVMSERVKSLESPSARLATVLFVLGSGQKESTWDVESLPGAGTRLRLADPLGVEPPTALTNLVPTQAIMRILRDTDATAAALVAPIGTAAITIQLADADHEQSLTARVMPQKDSTPALGQWDFGRVLWSVRLRQMLLAARRDTTSQSIRLDSKTPPIAAAPPTPTVAGGRRHQMREMREQLHRKPAAAPSWLQ